MDYLINYPASLFLCTFYLNELLLRLLPKDDPYPEVFADYQAALQALQGPADEIAPITRLRNVCSII